MKYLITVVNILKNKHMLIDMHAAVSQSPQENIIVSNTPVIDV